MVKKTSIGVFGNGFVGGSITTVFTERGFGVYAYDKGGRYVKSALSVRPPNPWRKQVDPNLIGGGGPYVPKTQQQLDDDSLWPTSAKEFIQGCEKLDNFSGIFFVCLPTPMATDGSADLSIVEGVLEELANTPGEKDRIAVIKSTVPPGSTEKWNQKYKGTKLTCAMSPEFLTEINAEDDMRNQDRIVIGGPRPHINKVKQLFGKAFPKVPIIKTNSTTAEMVKYFTNVQLATRVVLSCELSQICDALDKSGMDVDYDKVLEYARYDKRLGDSHMNASGNDGVPGARGHCFPKDLRALTHLAKTLDVNPKVLEAVWSKNLDIIPEEHRDWERMPGRAVSNKK